MNYQYWSIFHYPLKLLLLLLVESIVYHEKALILKIQLINHMDVSRYHSFIISNSN